VDEVLRTLSGLRKGRTDALESGAVRPVDLAHVTASLTYLTPHMKVVVELQRLIGMRPGEVSQLRLGEGDRTNNVRVYNSIQRKTAHHGKPGLAGSAPNR
jgi:hypothetical protein